MNYQFIDINPTMVEAWKEHFQGHSKVEIILGDATQHTADAIVSPANSFGFMDGGIDYALSERLGWDLQEQLQAQIAALPEGELLIGKALILATKDVQIPHLIVAPTMRVPMSFNIATSVNPYLAMKATLLIAKQHPAIQTVLIPGFCTGIGRMPPSIAALQMWKAFQEVVDGEKLNFEYFSDAQKQHWQLNPSGKIYN
ncbi:MAG: macro domain-containing protein [Aureispira sp.]